MTTSSTLEIQVTEGSSKGQYRASRMAYSSVRYLGPRPRAPTMLCTYNNYIPLICCCYVQYAAYISYSALSLILNSTNCSFHSHSGCMVYIALSPRASVQYTPYNPSCPCYNYYITIPMYKWRIVTKNRKGIVKTRCRPVSYKIMRMTLKES